MRTCASRLTTLGLWLLILSTAAHAQTVENGRWENGITEAWGFDSHNYTVEQSAAARARWQQIESEGGTGSNDWAGDYQKDMSVRLHVLRWSPTAGFVFFNVNSCMANVDHLDYGEVVADAPSHLEVVSKRLPGAGNKRKFVKVKWGQQRYLIEEHGVPGFCDYVAGLGAHNGGVFEEGFLLHGGDSNQPTAVLPTVPPEYRKFVRRPVDAIITKVGKSYTEVDPENEGWNDLVTPVTINVGSNREVRRGMKIHILDSDEFDESVEITRVGVESALGIIVRSVRKRPGVKLNEWDDGEDAPEQPISVGWRLTTSLHKRSLRSESREAAWEARQTKH
ncbi:MAG TPA: hypothetical protein VER76_10595 [Pyrinomonadaceae bacterium]|nr:hypothetical protein [Pyrinomonadaceae bacterium]